MACLRTEPFSGAGAATSSGGRNGRETPSDGFMVSRIAANWTSGNDSATIEPLEGGGASSPSLRGPSSMISRPEPRAGHRARLRPRLRSLLRLPRPCTAPGAPDRPSRSSLRPWVRCAADFRPGPAAGTVGLPLPTLRRRVATIAAAAQRPGSRRSRNTRPCVSSYRCSRACRTAVRKKEPLLIEQLPTILPAMPDDELATRNRALLLLGYVSLSAEQARSARRQGLVRNVRYRIDAIAPLAIPKHHAATGPGRVAFARPSPLHLPMVS